MTTDADQRWEGLSTSLVSDCLGRLQAMAGEIRRLAGSRVAGPAFPVEVVAGESGTLHRALLVAPPGSVLVVAAGGYTGRAVWGEILTVAALQRGLRGLVLDGVVRDLDAIAAHGFPVFARGTCPAGPHKSPPGRSGEPVACGGVVVAPGDVVLGDGDGVVVVPAAAAEEVHARARERLGQEQEWLRRLRGGETTVEILGLDAGGEARA
jgi:4-hydroxy-4-methyl-2-oxoglutarate aldolase